jgi:hypothetical protein
MHLDGRTRLRLGTATNRLYRWLAVLFPISIAGSVSAQSYLAPPPGFQGAPAVPTMGNVTSATTPNSQPQTIDQLNTALANMPPNGQSSGQPNAQPKEQANVKAEGKESGKESGSVTALLIAPVESLMQWGALHLHTRAGYQFLYATGIHSEPGKSSDTFTHTLSPGLTLDLGPHVILDYTASLRFFSERNFHDTVDHSANLVASLALGQHWTFGLNERFSRTDEPEVQTSRQTQQTSFGSGLTAAYNFNDKSSLETGAGVNLVYLGGGTNIFAGSGTNTVASALSDSQSYYGSERFNYKFSDKISAGVGVVVDYAEQSSGFRIVDQNFNGDLTWRPGSKLTALLSAGIQHRQVLTSGSSDSWDPTFSANVGYHLFDQTTLTIYANRSSAATLFQNQLGEFTTFGTGFQQRLLGKVQLNLGFGYTRTDYQTTTANMATARSDEGTSYTAGLSYALLTRFNLGTFYQYSRNHSSANGFGYSSSEVGASVSWAY